MENVKAARPLEDACTISRWLSLYRLHTPQIHSSLLNCLLNSGHNIQPRPQNLGFQQAQLSAYLNTHNPATTTLRLKQAQFYAQHIQPHQQTWNIQQAQFSLCWEPCKLSSLLNTCSHIHRVEVSSKPSSLLNSTHIIQAWPHWNSSKLNSLLNTSSYKTHKRLKECFLIGWNRTKHAHFWGSPLFQATYNRKTEKEDFLKNVHVLSCFIQLKSILLISCVFWISMN